MKRRIVFLWLAALGAAIAFAAANVQAYEEPAYTTIPGGDGYELRRYEPYIVAETQVRGDFRSSGRAAFQRLAGLQSGAFGKKSPRPY